MLEFGKRTKLVSVFPAMISIAIEYIRIVRFFVAYTMRWVIVKELDICIYLNNSAKNITIGNYIHERHK